MHCIHLYVPLMTFFVVCIIPNLPRLDPVTTDRVLKLFPFLDSCYFRGIGAIAPVVGSR